MITDAASTAEASLYESYTIHLESVLPTLSKAHKSRGKMSRGKADGITRYIQVSAPVGRLWQEKALLLRRLHKEIGTESTHHTDKSRRGSRQNISPCGYKILPTTLYNTSSDAIPINTAEFTAALVSFPPVLWHHSLCVSLLIWDLYLFFYRLLRYFNTTCKYHTEKLLKGSEVICLTFYSYILQK